MHRPGRLLGGMACPFLKAAVLSVDETVQTINEIAHEIQVCMFAAGAGRSASLAPDSADRNLNRLTATAR